MPSSLSMVESLYACAYLVSSVLGYDCVLVGPESQVSLELPPNHLSGCFCKRMESITGKVSNIDHFFSRCEQISQGASNETYAVYNCPHGLTNIIVPAYENGKYVAALQIGPIMTSESDDLLLRHGLLSRGADAKELDSLRDYLDSLPKGSISSIMTIAKVINALVTDDNLVFRSLSMDKDIEDARLEPDIGDDIVCSVQEFVVNNFTDNEMSLDMVAKHVYVHPSYVSRIFSNQFNTPFRSYVNGLRINLAAKMLAETDSSIGDICHEVGFSDHSYFNKIFKQQRGVTPSEYRARLKEDEPGLGPE
ncbi:MAG: helix-turn-helix domain-containing protein [Eggerthellaceae bacterium]|nr:helix-turn-helix domain-containing protein [Eggerthellaceae bacterium]